MASSSSGSSGVKRISDLIPFEDVAKLLEEVGNADTNDRKKKKLEKFVSFYRKTFKDIHKTLDSTKAGGDSLYPVIRVLIPQTDRGRKAYGFKSSSLGRMFAQILGLDKNSKDGRSLIEFKDPSRAGMAAGDISAIISNLLSSRFSSNDQSKQKMSLSDIHASLDRLAKGLDSDVNQEDQKKELQTVIRKVTALEGKWLIRLLLKDMRLGFSSKALVYGLIHKQARGLSERIGDLELLCQKLNDPSVNVSDDDIALFNHFQPMLATRMNIIDSAFDAGGSLDDSGVTKSKSKKDAVTLPPPPFYVETKWDGERFQIHFDGKQLKYFSRRGFDYTPKFNETMTPGLRPRISPGVTSFIVDGEMMAFNKKYKIFTQKGNNIDVKTMNTNNLNHCPVFVAFDLVYYNGQILLKTPLKQRREKLEKIFHVKEDVIRLSEVKTMNTKEQVIECLNSAIDDGEEGLIAKDMHSTYEPAKRLVTWLKIKPEYLEENTIDDLDLVIVGAYYTDSTRGGGVISHFLIALVDKSVPGKEEYFPLTTVGSGKLRSVAMKELIEELAPKFVKASKASTCNVAFRGRKKPDFMIDPRNSIVVQVKASEIIPSDVYAINYTLRFPRITKVRKDKSPRDVMTVQEFHRLREDCGGKLVKRTDATPGGHGHSRRNFFKKKRQHSENEDSDGDDENPGGKRFLTVDAAGSKNMKKEKEEVEALPGPSRSLARDKLLKGALFSKAPTKSPLKVDPLISKNANQHSVTKQIFNSKLFCVYGSSTWKSELEAKIKHAGGLITQNADVKGLYAVVGEKRTGILVVKATRSGKYDVLQSTWIHKCIDAGSEVALVPTDFWGMTAKTRKQFQDEYDEYGDSYTKELSLQETKELVQRVMETEDDGKGSNSKENTPSPTKPKPKAKKSPTPSPLRSQVATRRGYATSESESDESDDDETDYEDEAQFSLAGAASAAEEGSSLSTSNNSDVINEIFEEKDRVTWSFMSEVEIAVKGEIPEIILSKVKFYGGKVNQDYSSRDVTHVVVADSASPFKDYDSTALVVKQKWLEDCLEKKEVLDEFRYCVR